MKQEVQRSGAAQAWLENREMSSAADGSGGIGNVALGGPIQATIALHPPLHRESKAEIKKPRAIN